jgi:hypothetical protein
MTKVKILGQEPKEEKKPIEFKKALMIDFEIKEDPSLKPVDYSDITLICLNYGGGLDLMFAENNATGANCLYLGHFNDGIV